jgi:hypothetical protein
VKRTRRDEPIGVVIYTCMETSPGNSLSLSQTSKNVMFLFLSLTFFFFKIEEQKGRTGPGGGGDWYQKEGQWSRKEKEDEYSANNVHTCTQVQQ